MPAQNLAAPDLTPPSLSVVTPSYNQSLQSIKTASVCGLGKLGACIAAALLHGRNLQRKPLEEGSP
jgi:hypothetical protein